ncbi:Acyl-protein thioesterase 2 [Cichlidogyrus casuarinus]|uniref:palmitoyl-protein hydrolase n=1 Tax=Cichlidogyrus casuarinus TaxID=1844966 RepID=A0ABD2Q8A9_9PLAT
MFARPTRPVTLNMGMQMPAWFDIFDLGPNAKQDGPGIKATTDQIRALVEKEAENGIKVALGGFSQGGAISLYYALTKDKAPRLSALLALSAWLPLHTELGADTSQLIGPSNLPVFQGHGTQDTLVPEQLGRLSHNWIKQFGLSNLDYKTYRMDHSSCIDELNDIKRFLESNIS